MAFERTFLSHFFHVFAWIYLLVHLAERLTTRIELCADITRQAADLSPPFDLGALW